jgi:signal transduction histidine kinase
MISVPSWWRRRSLRARLTIVTTAGLAVALVVAAAAVWVILFSSLIHGLDNNARQGAQQVAALADAHRLPSPVPVAGSGVTIQVLDSSGRIVDASPTADRLVPLLPPAQASANARSGRAVLLNGRPYGIPSELRVVAVRAPRTGYTIIAAVSFSSAIDSVKALSHALFMVTPLLLLLLAWAVWLVVGSALRPIAGLRRGAQEVTATGRPRALPVPEARDEVHSLAVTLNDMLARLDAAQQRQRSLVSDTAHELRSPIASIRAQLEVALDHPEQQEWPDTAADVLADTLRLGRLAEDLLVLARLDECDTHPGGRKDAPPVDLAALVTGEVRRAADTRVPVAVAAPEPCFVLGDAESLRRVLLNLVENAVRYAKSKVDVSVTAEGAHVLLTVTDDGPGIPEADRERVFGRFVRLDEARSREDDGAGGAGLGLAIVQALARAYGGRAELQDASPGLRAVVRLPAAPAPGGQ